MASTSTKNTKKPATKPAANKPAGKPAPKPAAPKPAKVDLLNQVSDEPELLEEADEDMPETSEPNTGTGTAKNAKSSGNAESSGTNALQALLIAAAQAGAQAAMQVQAASAPASKSKAIQAFEHNAELEARKAAANMKRQVSMDDLVTIQIPSDPRGDIPVFARSYNGVVYKFKAGELREVPRTIAREIMKSISVQIISERRASEYAKGAGKNLGTFQGEAQ